MGVSGAMFQMIAHGISSAGMFFLVGVVYDRVHHRDLDQFGGLFQHMPIYGGISMVIFFAALGLPGLCGFIGEVFVVLSAWSYSMVLAVIAASVVILTAGYILWTIQRVYLGPEYKGPHAEALQPMTRREIAIAAPLVVMAVLLGVYPAGAAGLLDAHDQPPGRQRWPAARADRQAALSPPGEGRGEGGDSQPLAAASRRHLPPLPRGTTARRLADVAAVNFHELLQHVLTRTSGRRWRPSGRSWRCARTILLLLLVRMILPRRKAGAYYVMLLGTAAALWLRPLPLAAAAPAGLRRSAAALHRPAGARQLLGLAAGPAAGLRCAVHGLHARLRRAATTTTPRSSTCWSWGPRWACA